MSLPLDTSHWTLNFVASSFSILCDDLLIIHNKSGGDAAVRQIQKSSFTAVRIVKLG
jgi:hypothetical protein